MSGYPTITLKEGKETNLVYRHPWIFSGALAAVDRDIPHGSLVWVADIKGNILATGTYSAHTTIAVRIFEFSKVEINRQWLRRKLSAASERRAIFGFGPGTATTGYRLVFGESDALPGIVIDRYDEILVLQLSTAGADLLRNQIVDVLLEMFQPRAIVERSDIPVRAEEKLSDAKGILSGESPELVEFKENGLNYLADVMNGQKTGFYLDQKELRAEIARVSVGRKTLNLFSYSGASGIAALKGGAVSVMNVDSSEQALALSERIRKLNNISADIYNFKMADIFNWLAAQSKPEYDLVLLDPPALIKSRNDRESGQKAYHFINRAALRLVNDGGIFVSSSCSSFFSEDDLAFTLRRASVQANLSLELLQVVRQSPDHPVSFYFPESMYLKSFICRVRR
jgi:23S rRNA (cytosine1962-C5)-methyltransferase